MRDDLPPRLGWTWREARFFTLAFLVVFGPWIVLAGIVVLLWWLL